MCNGGGNSVQKFAAGGSTGTRSKSAPNRPDSGGSNLKSAPKPTVAAAPNRAKAGDASFQKSVADRELDRLVQQTLSAPLPAESHNDFMQRLTGEANKYASTFNDRKTPASAYVNMPMSEYGSRVARNFLPSAAEIAVGLGSAALHPLDTTYSLAKGIGQLGYGAGSKIARNVFGYEGNRTAEAPLDAAISSTKGRYGLGEPGEFWKNLADNPASYVAEVAGARFGGGKVAGVVDDAQKAQYARFIDDNTPKTDVSQMAGFQYYRPSPLEAAQMGPVSGFSNSGLNKTQQMYLDSVHEADLLRTRGAPEQFIQEQTGILTIPVKNPRGSSLGDLDVAAVLPQEMIQLRPSRASNYGANIFDDPDLSVKWYDPTTWGNNVDGYHYMDPQTGIHQIGLNPKISQTRKDSVVKHEMTHADLEESKLGTNIVGANDEDMLTSKNTWLSALKEEGRRTKDPVLKSEIKAARDKLAGMTARELYSWNPGEMLARLAQGDPTMARRLRALEVFNPYINKNQNLFGRGIKSLGTAAFTETRPAMSKLKEILKPYGVNPSYDLLTGVPMDIDKAIVAGLGSSYIPRYNKP